MSIVEAVLDACSESWICHSCESQTDCSGGVVRGNLKLKRLVEDTPKPHVVVDLDSVPCLKEKGRCDFLYFAVDKNNKQWFAPIEASLGKSKKAVDIQRQLQLSADMVGSVLEYKKDVEFLPVFAGRSRESREVRFMTVKYKGKAVLIEVLNLNDRIFDYMEKYSGSGEL